MNYLYRFKIWTTKTFCTAATYKCNCNLYLWLCFQLFYPFRNETYLCHI